MTRTVIAAAAVALGGVYLRKGTMPVIAAYQIGRRPERIISRTRRQ